MDEWAALERRRQESIVKQAWTAVRQNGPHKKDCNTVSANGIVNQARMSGGGNPIGPSSVPLLYGRDRASSHFLRHMGGQDSLHQVLTTKEGRQVGRPLHIGNKQVQSLELAG
jgi:hypothetical protein